MIRTLLIVLFSSSIIAQIKTSNIKVVTKTYNACRQLENEAISGSYPYILSPKNEISKFINDTIQAVVKYDIKNKRDKINCWDGIDQDLKPSEVDFSFESHSINSYMLCLTIFKNSYAGGYGNGSEHISLPLTFDLIHFKILKLKATGTIRICFR